MKRKKNVCTKFKTELITCLVTNLFEYFGTTQEFLNYELFLIYTNAHKFCTTRKLVVHKISHLLPLETRFTTTPSYYPSSVPHP